TPAVTTEENAEYFKYLKYVCMYTHFSSPHECCVCSLASLRSSAWLCVKLLSINGGRSRRAGTVFCAMGAGQQVAHLVALGLEVAAALLDLRRDDRDLIDDLEVVAVVDEGVGLLGVIGQQADAGEAQVLEDLQADAVIARVGAIAEGHVGLDRVKPL